MPAERAARNSAPFQAHKELPISPRKKKGMTDITEASPYADVYAVAERYLDSPKNSRSRQWRDMTDGFLRDAAMEAQSRRILGETAISFIRRRAIDKGRRHAQSFRSLRTEAAGRDEDRAPIPTAAWNGTGPRCGTPDRRQRPFATSRHRH